MSVTIINTPKPFDFGGNGLKYKVKGDFYVLYETAKAHYAFRKVGSLDTGDSFNFAIPDNEDEGITVSAQTPPIAPGDYHIISAGATIDETIDELRNIYDLNEIYKIWKEGTDEIHLEYRELAGIDCSWVFFGGDGYEDIYDDPNLCITHRLSRIVQENYHINAVVSFNDEIVSNVKVDVDKDGFADLDFGKFMPKNIFEIGNIYHNIYKSNIDLSYQISFSEHFQNLDFKLTKDIQRQVMPGKLPFEKYPNFSAFPTFFNILRKQIVNQDSFLKLCYFFGSELPETISFNIKFYYTDKTTEEISLHSETADTYDIFFLDLNVAELINQSNSTKELYRFDITAGDTFDTSSKFYLRKSNYLDKEFAFKNSFGVFETFTATGHRVTDKVIKKELYKKYTPSDYEAINGEFNTQVKSSHSEYSVSTGNMNIAEINQIADALKSELFYERVNSVWIKCELLDSSVKISDEEDFVHSLTFKYRYSSDD